MGVYRLFTGQDGESHIEELAARVASSSLVSWTLQHRQRPSIPPPNRLCPAGPWDWGQRRQGQSAACHSQSTPPSSSHSSTMTDHTWFNTPGRWIVLSSPKVLGRWFHWQPLRKRKIIPLRIGLGLTRLRPVVLGGVPSRITGSTFSPNRPESPK